MVSKKSIILLLILITSSFALESKNSYKLGISFNYPGVGLKYILKNNSLELRYQTLSHPDHKAELFGFRYYRTFPKNLLYYLGSEISLCDVKMINEDYSSSVFLVGVFGGVEKFLYRSFSVNIDIGPYVALGNVENIQTIEYDLVLNFALNLYFSKRVNR